MEVSASSELVLPYTASSVGIARRRLIGDLAVAGIYEGSTSDAAIVISELISNALRHATPLPGCTLQASWRLLDDSVEIAVSDGGGETVPTVHQPAGWAIGGRGLGIVDRLSSRWGVSGEAGKTTVWARLPVRQGTSERLVAGGRVSAG
ncbi:MAG TPA: ATP-binding protein [Trebonia sp.]|nr:ATP-binding protein [Trebonia sp.]